MPKNPPPSKKKLNIPLITFLSVIGVIGLWLVYWYVIVNSIAQYQERGQYGDMFGAINALFTGLAFAGVIITIVLQSQELSLQRDELIETREEFKKQNRTLVFQRFENTFFNLLDQYKGLNKNGFNAKVGGMNGEAVFKETLFAFLKSKYNHPSILSPDGKIYVSYSYLIQDELGPNIRTFEAIVEYVYDQKKTAESRMKYLKFFFSQLTNFELMIYFYHFNLREQDPPVGFNDYQRQLFDSLHTSPMMPKGHYMEISNKDIKKN